MEGWKDGREDGRVEEKRKIGRMEEKMEGWKGGRVEEWKDGRVTRITGFTGLCQDKTR